MTWKENEKWNEPVFNYTEHRELWDWISKNSKKLKEEWPKWRINGGQYEMNEKACFACDYKDNTKSKWCENCPLVWINDIKCYKDNSLYDIFAKTPDVHLRIKCAEMIRDLKVKDGVKYI